ncbi:hypothetical protein ACFWN1_29600 [Streptomyces sp. NPDC058459]|uniref:hypothetical protein n=1 Tax=Streptomyces sp. NPDC058459 TaxID=3346508 RepID=UPI003646559B
MPMLESHPAAFPVDPPTDPDDPDVVAAHDWAAFEEIHEVADHWQRPGWGAGTHAYYWLLTFPDAAFNGQIAQLQSVVAPFPYDPIPAGGIHLTLGRIGTVERAGCAGPYARSPHLDRARGVRRAGDHAP